MEERRESGRRIGRGNRGKEEEEIRGRSGGRKPVKKWKRGRAREEEGKG